MSDRLRTAIGSLMLVSAVFLTFSEFFPLYPGREYLYYSPDSSPVPAGPISHLSWNDPVNNGDLEKLVQLPGIGVAIAEMICVERDKNGKYQYPEDLIAVKGIGSSKLHDILPFLTLVPDESGD